jgi:putative FmdB family regulatory protein
MPIYEYQCQSCEHIFDVLQKMSDDPLTFCPECGEPQLKKLLSAPNFRLKGGGWYETDFKKDSDKKRNLAGDAKKTGSDTKPDAKPDKKAAKSDGAAKSD